MKEEHFEHVGTQEVERALLRLVLEVLDLLAQVSHLVKLLFALVILGVWKVFILIILLSCLIDCLLHFCLHMYEFFEKLRISVSPHI